MVGAAMSLEVADEVATALREGRPVVALETSVVAQGLPPPANLEAARRCAAAVRAEGAVPAAVAVIEGRIVVGASDADIERLADPARKPAKAGSRDLAAVCAERRDAGTTVSATCAIAERAGIRVFATGGIGGVHRRGDPFETPDVSSDLAEIARRRVCVVCAGPKVILDLPATAELLETLAVPVWGYRTSELPAFFTDASGIWLEHRFDDAAQIASALRVHWDVLGSQCGVVVAVPPPSPLPRAEVETALAGALREAAARKLPGKEVTPFLLSALAQATSGKTRAANLELLENNTRIAARIARALLRASLTVRETPR
jgi:pseudouridine-5'-phosphate glycosidase